MRVSGRNAFANGEHLTARFTKRFGKGTVIPWARESPSVVTGPIMRTRNTCGYFATRYHIHHKRESVKIPDLPSFRIHDIRSSRDAPYGLCSLPCVKTLLQQLWRFRRIRASHRADRQKPPVSSDFDMCDANCFA